jgi:tryptophanyl-tRNA synthetase
VDVEEHRRLGGRTNVDVSYQYLTYFLEDDERLREIREQYESGEMLTGELKKIAITEIWGYIGKFQQRRARITDDVLNAFMDSTRALRLSPRYNWSNEVLPTDSR